MIFRNFSSSIGKSQSFNHGISDFQLLGLAIIFKTHFLTPSTSPHTHNLWSNHIDSLILLPAHPEKSTPLKSFYAAASKFGACSTCL